MTRRGRGLGRPPLDDGTGTVPSPDITAPTLSLATGVATGPTTATVGVTSDDGGSTAGYLYRQLRITSTSADSAELIAGTGTFVQAGSFNMTDEGSGIQTFDHTGLSEGVALYAHFVQQDSSGNISNVEVSAEFTPAGVAETLPSTFPYDFGPLAGAVTFDVPGWDTAIGCQETPTNKISTGFSSSSIAVATGAKTFTVDQPSNTGFDVDTYVSFRSISKPEVWIRGRVTAKSGSDITVDITHKSAPINGTTSLTDWRVIRHPAQGSSNTSFTVGTGSKTFALTDQDSEFVVGDYAVAGSKSLALSGTGYMGGDITAYVPGVSVTINVRATNGTQTKADWQIIGGTGISFSSTSAAIALGSKTFTLDTVDPYWGFTATRAITIGSKSSPANKMLGTITSWNSGTRQLVVNVTSVSGAATLADWIILSDLPTGWTWDSVNLRILTTNPGTYSNWDFRGLPACITFGGTGPYTMDQCVFDLSRNVNFTATAILNKPFFTSSNPLALHTFSNYTFDGVCDCCSFTVLFGTACAGSLNAHIIDFPFDQFFVSAGGSVGITVEVTGRYHVSGMGGNYFGFHPDNMQYTSLPPGAADDIGVYVHDFIFDGRTYKDASQQINGGPTPTVQAGVIFKNGILMSVTPAPGGLPYGDGLLADGTALGAFQILGGASITSIGPSVTRANSTAYPQNEAFNVASNPTRLFVVTTFNGGTTAGSEPAGYATAVSGSVITDGTLSVTARERYRKNSTAYAASGGFMPVVSISARPDLQFVATTAGTSAASEPGTMAAANDGDTGITDGTIVWRAQSLYCHLHRFENIYTDGGHASTGVAAGSSWAGGGYSFENFFLLSDGSAKAIRYNYDGAHVQTNVVLAANKTLPAPSDISGGGSGTTLTMSFTAIDDDSTNPDVAPYATAYQYSFDGGVTPVDTITNVIPGGVSGTINANATVAGPDTYDVSIRSLNAEDLAGVSRHPGPWSSPVEITVEPPVMLQDLNTVIGYPNFTDSVAGAVSVAGDAVIDAAGEYYCYVFQAREAMTITHIGFRCGTAAGSPTLDIRVETVDPATGLPTGTLWDTNTNIITGTLSTSTNPLEALTAPAVIAKGEIAAIKLLYNSGTSVNVNRTNSMVFSYNNMPYEVVNTGTPTKGRIVNGFKSIAVGSSATTFYNMRGLVPISAVTTTTFNNASADTRQGLRFQLPFKARVAGAKWYNGASVGDYTLTVYDDVGTELSSSSTAMEGDISAASAAGVINVLLDNPVEVDALTWYRIVLEPTSSTVITLVKLTLPSADYMTCMPGGVNWHLTTYDGAWDDTATSTVPLMDLLFDQLPDG